MVPEDERGAETKTFERINDLRTRIDDYATPLEMAKAAGLTDASALRHTLAMARPASLE